MSHFGYEAADELPGEKMIPFVDLVRDVGPAIDTVADEEEVAPVAGLGIVVHTLMAAMRARGVEADELRSLTDSAIAYGEQERVRAIWADDAGVDYDDSAGDARTEVGHA